VALPLITISGKVEGPDGSIKAGTIAIVLVTDGGAASVTDDTDSNISYKLDKRTIKAKVSATGEVFAEDGTSPLQLVPNALIEPQTTHYLVKYSFPGYRWQETWYLENADAQIGSIRPLEASTSTNPTTAQMALLGNLRSVDGSLFMYDVTRDKWLSLAERREVFTIKNLAQPAQFAFYHQLVSSDSGIVVAQKETLVGFELSAGNTHSATYSVRSLSDLLTDLVSPVTVTAKQRHHDYTLDHDFTPELSLAVYYNPVAGQEVNNANITLIFKERL
jgi:hypothetical protein